MIRRPAKIQRHLVSATWHITTPPRLHVATCDPSTCNLRGWCMYVCVCVGYKILTKGVWSRNCPDLHVCYYWIFVPYNWFICYDWLYIPNDLWNSVFWITDLYVMTDSL